MYNLLISAKARRELKKISRFHKGAIVSALEDIREDPLLGKPLTRELTGKFSFKVGVYRIIYKVNQKDKVVQVLTAGHRSKVYQ